MGKKKEKKVEWFTDRYSREGSILLVPRPFLAFIHKQKPVHFFYEPHFSSIQIFCIWNKYISDVQ